MADLRDLDAELAELVIVPSRRGMAEAARELRPDLFTAAAAELRDVTCPIVIATGFPVRGKPETDGPPGAFVLADALLRLGKDILIASWAQANAVLAAIRPDLAYFDVPIGPNTTCKGTDSMALVAIEACGRTHDGTYRNMRDKDISAFAPRFEDCFGLDALVAIGDGGNELGMGGLSPAFYQKHGIAAPVSHARHVVPGTTSNYAAYALVCALGAVCGINFLPDPDEHIRVIERLVEAGFVDGVSGKCVPRVDGFALVETRRLLETLHGLTPDTR